MKIPVFTRLPCLLAWGGIALLLPGCHRADLDIAPVTGIVTLDGVPLEGAVVAFSSGKGRPSLAVTQEDGSYELTYTASRKGALVGPHTVRITTERNPQEGSGNQPGVKGIKEFLPPRYHEQTELTANVISGSNKIDFALTK
ncbi:hypothetical protein [Planctomicrobium sp. SH664]|uniref:hypothetical protein n=1 Tax=Planctomicrobium sp. SH664 TaxID=3448125 RepID=UPI003F5C71F6